MQLKEAERKARTRQLIQAGGLVEKAGLLALDANALYGLLLAAKTGADDPDTLAHWTALGGRAFLREARAAGLRFNRLRAEWEGRAEFDKAAAIANDHGGAIRRVGTGPLATAAQ